MRRIESGEALVGIIGTGYVGLPLADAMHRAGLRVLAFDIDPDKVRMLNTGQPYLKHMGVDVVRCLAESERFEATGDFSRLSEPDAIVVCVPTPLGAHQEPDLSYVLDTARAIGSSLRVGQIVSLESTTYPGTTRDEFLPAIMEAARARGALACGTDFFVVFSPEREDPGRTSHTTRNTPKLVGGVDGASTAVAAALYRKAVAEVVEVSSAEVAEAAKLLENIFRSVNIALVNEMKMILSEMSIDVWEVIRAASTKPFGFMPFYPGPGLGGHCIPIDPFYLSWKAREIGRPTRFIELAGQVNTEMPGYVVERLMLGLNRFGRAVRGARVLVIGLAYKPDIDDVRESPSFELIERLRELGAEVSYHDPLVPRTKRMRRYDLSMESIALTPESIASYDAVLISTAHTNVDYGAIAQHSRLVVDTRDAMRPFADRMGERLIRA